MRQYCSIPTSTRITKRDDIHRNLAALFQPYGADTWVSGGYGYDRAAFNLQFPTGTLSFEIPMPSLYDWIFCKESPKEMAEGFEQYGNDYEPMRCIPEEVSRQWN